MTNAPQRILLIRPSALGDVCRSVCVLASLRRAYPDVEIDWVVQHEFAAAVAAHPALNEVITFHRSRWASWWRSPRAMMELLGWLREVRRRRYDLVIDCQGLGRSGLISLATGAPRRVGLRQARELAWLGYNIRVPRDRAAPLPRHTVDQMLLLVEQLGVEPVRDMRLYVTDEHRDWWQEKRLTLKMQSGPIAVLAPTSRWPSKRWPMDRLAQLIEPLVQRGFAHAVIIGSPGEVAQVKPLIDQLDRFVEAGFVVDLVGKTGIGQTMAVLAEAGLVVANDSAPLHMAVGFDRPCVGLFGPTDPAEVGPYRREECVVRGYHPRKGETVNFKDQKLGDSLMRFISTSAVIQKIDRVLSSRTDRGAVGNDQRPAVDPQAAESSP